MAQTKEGAIKARAVMVAKYGGEEGFRAHLQAIGGVGGKKGNADGVIKGFAAATPQQRSEWGKRGGAKSRRPKRAAHN